MVPVHVQKKFLARDLARFPPAYTCGEIRWETQRWAWHGIHILFEIPTNWKRLVCMHQKVAVVKRPNSNRTGIIVHIENRVQRDFDNDAATK
jgi:hypothetical protein